MAVVHALLLFVCSGLLSAEAIKYNTSAKRDPDKLNVHLVPHTHDDSGWLKTFEQYYWGTRQDIQLAAVQHILSGVVQALLDNPDRKFSYGEMSFFSQWWHHQSSAVQAQVAQLVSAGRLTFINGGFVQHDEAAAHYVGMLDQTTRGHRFLNRTFGVTPKVAWQVDPFGHSSTQAALMSAAAGYEALVFGRADYQDMALRRSKQQLELLWRPSLSWGESGQIWTHNYPTGNYGPPPGFNYDYGMWDQPIVDDPASPEYNVPDRVEAFVRQARSWSEALQGNDVLYMMGSDFWFVNAPVNFYNMDRLIHYVNVDGRVNVLYSSPEEYVSAKAGYSHNNISWPVKTDDFFPYADCDHCYWTGYFTSRPTSKGYIRQATAYLAAARQLQVLVNLGPPHTATPTAAAAAAAISGSPAAAGPAGSSHQSVEAEQKGLLGRATLKQQQQQQQQQQQGETSVGSSSSSSSSEQAQQPKQQQQQQQGFSLDGLEFAVSLAQHHDAITGTEKQAVANDYARYLYLGMQQASELINAALLQLLNSKAPTPTAGASSSGSSGSSGSSSSNDKGGWGWMQQADRLYRLTSGYRPAGQSNSSSSSSSGNNAGGSTGLPPGHDASTHTSSAAAAAAATAAAVLGPITELHQCPLLNVSICSVSISVTHQAQAVQQPPSSSSSSSSSGLHVSATAATAADKGNGGDAGGGGAGASSSSSDSGSNVLLVVVYNSLGWLRNELVSVPVAPGHYLVQDADSNEVHSQTLPVTNHTQYLQQQLAAAGLLTTADAAAAAAGVASHQLVFVAENIPPVGYRTYAVQAMQPAYSSSSSSSSMPADLLHKPNQQQQQQEQQQQQRVVTNGILNLTLDASTGRFSVVSASDGSWSMKFSQDMMWYKSSNGEDDSKDTGSSSSSSSSNGGGGQSSGAYIFRPAADSPVAQLLVPADQPLEVTVTTGPVITEITQSWSSWASLTTRLVAGSGWLHQEWTVGPIPVDDKVGKEIVIRTNTDLKTGGVLFTDSNGREMLTRKLNHRPTWKLNVTEPVSGNYYPITSAAAVSDGCLMLAAATDRPQGAASLQDGQLEVMMHRVTVVDDARGVGEPLNETICGTTAATGGTCAAGGLPARGRHTYVIGPAKGAAASVRQAAQQLNDPVILAFSRLEGEASNSEVSLEVPEDMSGSGPAGGTTGDTSAAAANPAVPSGRDNSKHHRSVGGGVIRSLGIRGTWSGLHQEPNTPVAASAAAAAATGRGSSDSQTSQAAAAAAAAAAGVLPPNVHLLTLMQADEGSSDRIILRLAHTLQVGEDEDLSAPAQVDISKLLNLASTNRRISNISELSLTAARYRADMQPPRTWAAGEMILAHRDAAPTAPTASLESAAPAALEAIKPARRLQHVLEAVDKAEHATTGSGSSGSSSDLQEAAIRWGDALAWIKSACSSSSSSSGGSRIDGSSSGLHQPSYDIWAHAGDELPVVELYPMEIRTWEIITAASA